MTRTWFAPHLAAALAAAGFACGASSKSDEPTTAAPPSPPATAESTFQNPGGMWMPSQLSEHAATLEKLGLEIPVADLAQPTAAPLGAIVSLGGCSASFVSPDGLIITNHHCVKGALQYHSTPEQNLVETGFLAKTRAEEKWNGPTAKVWVTQNQKDVTDTVLAGLAEIDDDKARYEEIEKREKALVASCEKDRPSVRCKVASYFRGAEYRLVEMLEISDVRLVYAPHEGIGWFGGDEDNWMWPRHTGDYSFYRAYVGPDGAPADHSADNVPYQPKHFLKVAQGDLDEGDLVMVAGYPGSTYRHKTAFEVKEAVEWSYPRKIAAYGEYLETLNALEDPQAKIKAQSWIFGLANAVKNYHGMIDGLQKGGLAAEREATETKLRAWIAEDEARQAKYGHVFAALDELAAKRVETRERDSALSELGFSRLLGAASTIVRMAEERPLPDAERDPQFQERNWDRIRAAQQDFGKKYNRKLDLAMLALALERGARDPAFAEELTTLFGLESFSEADIRAHLERMYRNSKLEKDAVRLRLLDKATTASLKKSKDPFIRLAVALRPIQKEIEDREERWAGAEALIKPAYIAALREFSPGPMAPDANGTLRVTFGTVRGYKPSPEADAYNPFTVLSEVVGKHRDEKPFDVPDELIAAVRSERTSGYVDEDLGQVPVNFLSDLDTTGGNSGSATLNGRGELIGLLFDGNYEAMASDWLFIPEMTRAIHVDIRYVLWIMDAVDGADHLLEEMGVAPKL